MSLPKLIGLSSMSDLDIKHVQYFRAYYEFEIAQTGYLGIWIVRYCSN